MEALLLMGRIVLRGFFIYSGANHFIGFGTMTQYAKMKGVPFNKEHGVARSASFASCDAIAWPLRLVP
jgi:hypothetical protein